MVLSVSRFGGSMRTLPSSKFDLKNEQKSVIFLEFPIFERYPEFGCYYFAESKRMRVLRILVAFATIWGVVCTCEEVSDRMSDFSDLQSEDEFGDQYYQSVLVVFLPSIILFCREVRKLTTFRPHRFLDLFFTSIT